MSSDSPRPHPSNPRRESGGPPTEAQHAADAALTAEAVPPTLPPRQRNLAFGLITAGMLLAALDGTIVSTALPTSSGTSAAQPTWRGWSRRMCWPRRWPPCSPASWGTSSAARRCLWRAS